MFLLPSLQFKILTCYETNEVLNVTTVDGEKDCLKMLSSCQRWY